MPRSKGRRRATSSTSPIARAEASRRGQLELLAALGPDGIARELAALGAAMRRFSRASRCCRTSSCRRTTMCGRATWSRGASTATSRRRPSAAPADFAELLLTPGVGARTVRALALVAEVVHGAPCRFSDPARFSLAHGGKDRHPFPVPLKVYDETIRVLKSAVRTAKLGQDEELAALQTPRRGSRASWNAAAKGPTFEGLLAEERAHSHQYGGRSVFGWEPPVEPAADCRPA